MWKCSLVCTSLLLPLMACGSSDSGPKREIEPLAVELAGPTSITVGGDHIYWLCGVTRGKVFSLAKSGGTPKLLTDADSPHSIAVNDEFVYFGESDSALKRVSVAGGDAASVALQNVTDIALGTQRAFGSSADSNELWSVPLQGGALFNVEDFTFVESPSAIVLDGTEVFWINMLQGEISAFPIDPGEQPGAARVVASFAGKDTAELVSNSTHLFWPDHSTGEILSAPKTGAAPTVLASAAVQFLEVDANYIYFTSGEEGTFAIERVSIDGGDPELLIELDELPGGFAIDATHVYWTSPEAGTVQAVVKDL